MTEEIYVKHVPVKMFNLYISDEIKYICHEIKSVLSLLRIFKYQ